MTSVSTRWVSWILGCVLPPRELEVVIGDLVEECELRSNSTGAPQLSRWFWSQFARSVPSLLWASISRSGWSITVAVAVSACLVQAAIELVNKSAMSAFARDEMQIVAALSWVVGFPSLVLVSYLAARIRPGVAIMLPVIIAIAVVVQMVLRVHDMPLWKEVAALFVGPMGALAGGALSLRRRT